MIMVIRRRMPAMIVLGYDQKILVDPIVDDGVVIAAVVVIVIVVADNAA
jgi:hypothetical protein